MHFVVVHGKGTPIIFEAGGGDDASTWKDILQPISQITGAPLIAYDRPGFGKSGMDTVTHGIIHNIEGLETALKKLGFGGAVMYVAHSQGGCMHKCLPAAIPVLLKRPY